MKLRALVVDDEEFARKNLILLLEEFCPEIEVIGEASRKEQAKAIIETSKPDVVFLDIRMPSGSEGFELLEEIEEQEDLKGEKKVDVANLNIDMQEVNLKIQKIIDILLVVR